MIKSYLGLVIIFAVQHQVSSLSADVQHRLAQRKEKMKRQQDIHKKAEALQDPMDNYDLIVTEPSDTEPKTPIIRNRHHHRHRSGKGARVTSKIYKPHVQLEDTNVRKNFNLTGEMNKTIQEDKHAITTNFLNTLNSGKGAKVTIKNYNPHIPLEDANTLQNNFNITGKTNKTTQEDKPATMTNYLNENWREREKVATTQIQEHKDVVTSQKPVKTNQNETILVPFYRRLNYLNDQERKKPQKWVHCLDLIGPRLKGYEDNRHHKVVTNRHTDIRRLSELLSLDVSKFNEQEIVAILHQISNIDIRIFQWDYPAVTAIMNVVTRGATNHNFRTLKSGIKHLFDKWHLDTSSLRTFLEQTRIFRPPCIETSVSGDFTKKAGGVRLFTKPDKTTRKHRGDQSCHSRETTVDNDND